MDLENVKTTDLIEELISRKIDWRFYKRIYDERLAVLLKEYVERQCVRSAEFHASRTEDGT